MYISYEDTERAAEEFLAAHHSSRAIPIPIEEIVELKLQISIIPVMGLLDRDGIDAFLSHDFSTLTIDHSSYMGKTNRSRFTLAHEMGHLVLHREIVASITTLEEWKHFILGEGTRRSFLETHADNFAGCVLMPRKELLAEYQSHRDRALKQLKAAGLNVSDEQTLISFIANEIARKFDVSPKAAEVRLSIVLQRK